MKTIWQLILVLSLLLLNVACSEKPKAPETLKVGPVPLRPGFLNVGHNRALWIVTSDYSYSKLLRVELRPDQVGAGRVQTVEKGLGSDVILVPSPYMDEFFLLSRFSGDFIQIRKGSNGEVWKEMPLPRSFNAYDVALDERGRPWVAGLNSNQILVFDKDLDFQVNSIDVSRLQDGQDEYVEPTKLVYDKQNENMLVLLGRMKRGLSQRGWVPSDESGLVVIDTKRMDIEFESYLPINNPLSAYLSEEGELTVIGSGDRSHTVDLKGELGTFQLTGRGTRLVERKQWPELVSAAHFSEQGNLARIQWDKRGRKSCVYFRSQKLHCEGDSEEGFTFNQVAVLEDLVFASSNRAGRPRLWVFSLSTGDSQAIDLDQPILQLVSGP